MPIPIPIPIIGMIHLPPLTGYPTSPGLNRVIEHALRDLDVLIRAGTDGVLVENEHDQPHQVTASPEIIAAMTMVTAEVVRAAKNKIIVGCEILLNDPQASLAVANAAGARFMRTDYFVDRMTRDEYGGEMHIDPQGLIAYRQKIGAEHIAILTDIQVKYARMLETKTLATSAQQAVEAGSDGLIVSGNVTGDAPVTHDLDEASQAVPDFPVLIGSGLNQTNAPLLLPRCGGAIVGTGIMTNGRVDYDKTAGLMNYVYALRQAKR